METLLFVDFFPYLLIEVFSLNISQVTASTPPMWSHRFLLAGMLYDWYDGLYCCECDGVVHKITFLHDGRPVNFAGTKSSRSCRILVLKAFHSSFTGLFAFSLLKLLDQFTSQRCFFIA